MKYRAIIMEFTPTEIARIQSGEQKAIIFKVKPVWCFRFLKVYLYQTDIEKVVGEVTCYPIERLSMGKKDGKYVARNSISQILCHQSCRSEEELYNFGWDSQIDRFSFGAQLFPQKIFYDVPKSLSDFKKACDEKALGCKRCKFYFHGTELEKPRCENKERTITELPLDFCYVEELSNE